MNTANAYKEEQSYMVENENALEVLIEDDDDFEKEYMTNEDKEVFLRNDEISYSGEVFKHYTNQNVKFIDSEHTSHLVDCYQKETDEKKKNKLLNEIVLMSAGLVTSVAKKYTTLPGATFEDIIQAGMLGLLKAVKRYDYSKGFAFSTYAIHWIRQSITREYENTCSLIRKPIHFLAVENTYKKLVAEYMQEHNGAIPDDELIAEKMNIPVERIEEIRLRAYSIMSYDAPVSGTDSSKDDDMSLLDILADNDNTGREYMQSELLQIINTELMSCLNDKEQYIINERFGLNGSIPRTLEEIGNEMGVTRERIRQIESKAIGKLKFRARRKHLSYSMLHVED